MGKIIALLSRHNITLDVHHIAGELNSLADILSRTVERNQYTFHPSALAQCKLRFDFDLFGSSLFSLAPHFSTNLAYRARRLADCPPAPVLSVVAPPWNRILPLLSEAGADRAKIAGKILVLLPHWPARPWWPLAMCLAQGRILKFKGKPWVSPGGRRAPHQAVTIWVNK